jgi:hypothetical protein
MTKLDLAACLPTIFGMLPLTPLRHYKSYPLYLYLQWVLSKMVILILVFVYHIASSAIYFKYPGYSFFLYYLFVLGHNRKRSPPELGCVPYHTSLIIIVLYVLLCIVLV